MADVNRGLKNWASQVKMLPHDMIVFFSCMVNSTWNKSREFSYCI